MKGKQGRRRFSRPRTRASLDRAFEMICRTDRTMSPGTLKQVLSLAVELAREGREGRKVGTIFVVGDSGAVLEQSKCLILDPLWGHADAERRIASPDVRETVKELALLDGGFVVSDEGVVVSAARYFNASSEGIDLPLGLGGRHLAAASITRETGAVAVVVSESAVVRIFDDGELVSEVIPELWMLSHHNVLIRGDYDESSAADVTVLSK